jgi:hypothetical protein
MLSTRNRTVTQPGKKDLRLIDYFAPLAADILEAEYHAAHRHDDTVATDGSGFETVAPGPSSPEDQVVTWLVERLESLGGLLAAEA